MKAVVKNKPVEMASTDGRDEPEARHTVVGFLRDVNRKTQAKAPLISDTGTLRR